MAGMAMRFFAPGDHVLPLPARLRGIGVAHAQEPIRRLHGFPYWQWIQVTDGEALVETPDGQAVARAGDGIFLRPGEFHAYRSSSAAAGPKEGAGLVVNWVSFDGTGIGPALEPGPLGPSGVYRLARPGAVAEWFAEAWELGGDIARATPRRLSALVYRLLMELADAAAPPGQTPASDRIGRLVPLVRTLEARLAEPWTVTAMAGLLGVSAQHLGRLFAQGFGRSPSDYLIGLRMERACALLVDRPELRVHEVAEAVGYADVNLFVRRFRQRIGQTPGVFRARH